MTRVHFVYPYGPAISCPQTLGRNVATRLEKHYEVVQWDWADTHVLRPRSDDILLGHPHPAPWTIFRRSARQSGWQRVIMMTPFTHDPRQWSFCDSVVPRCNLYLAITGEFWFESVVNSCFAHWRPKMVHLDLAIDRADFPVIKRRFNPPGSRKFLYIGHDGWQKNPRYLEQIAKMMPDQTISWMGSGKNLEGLKRLGRQDFGSAAARRLVASHDFVLTVGSFDANPSTILEAMSWGLIPVCTPTSGYSGYPGITNVPLDDPGEAVHILESLQQVPEAHLMSIQEANWQSLDTHFNWDRFSDQVLDAIRSDRSPSIHREGLGRKLRLRGSAVVSPQQEVSARLLARTARRALVNR